MHVFIYLILMLVASLEQITFALVPTDKTTTTNESQLLATIALLKQRVQSLESQLKTQNSGNSTKVNPSEGKKESKSTKAARFFSAANALGLDTSILSTKKKDRKSKTKDNSVVNATVAATANLTSARKTIAKVVSVADVAAVTSPAGISAPSGLSTKPSDQTPPKTAAVPISSIQSGTGSSTSNTRILTKNGKTLLVPRTIDDFTGPSPHENKLFYMYELDESFWWRWPDPKADCTQNGYLDHPHALLSGDDPPHTVLLIYITCKIPTILTIVTPCSQIRRTSHTVLLIYIPCKIPTILTSSPHHLFSDDPPHTEPLTYIYHTSTPLTGMGPAIRPDDGLFLTWHFSLFSSLFNRLKRSSRRTRDPTKAR